MPGPIKDSGQASEQDSLINLLGKFRASKASDIRNKIFALHGLSSEPPDHRFLFPDYTKALPEVLHNILRYWFDETALTITQVIHSLACFETVHTTYLIPMERTQITRETIQVSLSSGKDTAVECVREALCFLIEQLERDTYQRQESPQIELDGLRVKLHKFQGGGDLRYSTEPATISSMLCLGPTLSGNYAS